jgi:polysaccharide export outer membrane protein
MMLVLAFGLTALPARVWAQAAQTPAGAMPEDPEVPSDYVIGPEDVLSIVFWRDQDMTADVVVRPDGKITLPLINDIQAAGLKPEELRVRVTEAASKLVESPNVMVRVREIKSRKVFITGMVNSPAFYPLVGPTTVLQLIATAGGLLEYAKTKDIRIVRTENGRQVAHRFNYNDVRQGKNLNQNIELKPGDTVIVP